MEISRRKSQISMEFVVIIFSVLLISTALLYFVQQRTTTVTKTNDQNTVKRLADIIIYEANNVKNAKSGFSRTFNISREIGGKDYTMKIEENSMLVINYSDQVYTYKLPGGVMGDLKSDGIKKDYEIILIKEDSGVTISVDCLNGITEGTEVCDDGNTNNNDACKNDCTDNVCGDGYVLSGPGACDDGCMVDTPNVCEPADNGDGCSQTCTIEAGWTCVGLNPSVCYECGNGIIEGDEKCDDGNPPTNGDGCSATCTIEAAWGCSGEPSVCVFIPICIIETSPMGSCTIGG